MTRRGKPARTAGLMAAGAAIALASVCLGGLHLVELSRAYRTVDIAYDETPATAGLWLRDRAAALDGDTDALADLVALRLTLQPIAPRYSLIRAFLSAAYWDRLDPDPAARAALREAVLRGAERALATAPGDGGLWLLASVLRTQAAGFDDEAASYLGASYVFAPKELPIALPRLAFSATLWPALPEDLRRATETNATVIATMEPRMGEEIARLFAGSGADLGALPEPAREE
ncbi:hypothetical protein HW532_13910 [Kaustia mangrovi]|uniref:Uncharacterized protein n=1 Tax=Kaustia mangrovi TaxID=2593653 RepID=A0A7S8C5G4_9HYPH|nr:hypothetical protein [Kaustia mangrovi]QPC43686.1 hypothetical protein HW532_13910 [Kaustia mangrovi]